MNPAPSLDGHVVPIDVDRLVDSRLLIQASSGGGKSWALRRILEQTHGKVQQVVLDIEGEFHTLREKFDYVLAGRGDGDCPAHPRAAPLLARRLLELGVSAIIDLAELEAHERYAFVRSFLKSLVEVDRSLWRPALIVIDEAHQFCPEHGKAESASAVIDLCTRGRKRGFAAVLATQRLSKLHKDAAAECRNKLVGLCNLDIDVKRAAEELGFVERADRKQLRELEPGEFFFSGPAFGIKGQQRVQIGGVQTKHLRPGERAARAVAPRDSVKKVLAQLADIPREAEQEAKDFAAAQQRIRELERELRQTKGAAPQPLDPQAIEKAREQGRSEIRRELGRQSLKLQAWLNNAATRAKDLAGYLAAVPALPTVESGAPLPAASHQNGTHHAPASRNGADKPRPAAPIQAEPRRASPPAVASGDAIDRPMQRVLDALAWCEAAGIEGPYSREQIAALAVYAATSGGFRNLLGRLSSSGLVSYPSAGLLALTDAGRAAANAPDTPTSAEEIQRRVLERIDAPMRRCLEPILAAYPKPLERAEVASVAQYEPSSGGFRNTLGRLSTLRVISYPKPGQVLAAAWLFLEGART